MATLPKGLSIDCLKMLIMVGTDQTRPKFIKSEFQKLKVKLRILFIIPYVPTRIRVRSYSLLKTMAERGHQVTLATLWSSETEHDQLVSLEKLGLKVLAVPLSHLRSLRNCLGVLPT